MTISVSSLLLALIGAAVYVLATTSPKAAELGRLTFAVSLLAALLRASWDVVVRLGGH
jgi:hypothetical protein